MQEPPLRGLFINKACSKRQPRLGTLTFIPNASKPVSKSRQNVTTGLAYIIHGCVQTRSNRLLYVRVNSPIYTLFTRTRWNKSSIVRLIIRERWINYSSVVRLEIWKVTNCEFWEFLRGNGIILGDWYFEVESLCLLVLRNGVLEDGYLWELKTIEMKSCVLFNGKYDVMDGGNNFTV